MTDANVGGVAGCLDNHWSNARANSLKPLQCEGQDSNLHIQRTLEPKSSASANSATLAYGVISEG